MVEQQERKGNDMTEEAEKAKGEGQQRKDANEEGAAATAGIF